MIAYQEMKDSLTRIESYMGQDITNGIDEEGYLIGFKHGRDAMAQIAADTLATVGAIEKEREGRPRLSEINLEQIRILYKDMKAIGRFPEDDLFYKLIEYIEQQHDVIHACQRLTGQLINLLDENKNK